jgi:hypothetical protein
MRNSLCDFFGTKPPRAIQKNKIVIAHHDLTPAMVWWNRMHAYRASNDYRGIIRGAKAAHFKPGGLRLVVSASEIAL